MTKLAQFLFGNFGPLIIFYAVNSFAGFLYAIALSIFYVILEFGWLKFNGRKITTFFYFSSGIVIVFGVLDLLIREPFFFKFEALVINLLFAFFFGLSLFKDKSIVQEFAETQKKISAEQSDDKRFFFKFITLFWCAYFVIKGFFYLWLNFKTGLDEALVLRMVIGKISFWIMMFISIGMSGAIWRGLELLRWMPSSRRDSRISA